ncbi:MAG: prepilin-type N-terminal cleavage/methylation domain-containing protein [Pirellulaceae bacterium]
MIATRTTTRTSRRLACAAARRERGHAVTNQTSHRRSPRSAFTLLEVLLALALSVLVVGAISSALYFHLRILEDQRNRVEQALVARGLLQMMANDIRSGVQYKPVDISQLEALMAGTDLTALMAASGMDADELGLDPAAADDGSTGESTDDPLPRPGLFGNAESIQIDISRMPRRDEYLNGVALEGQDFSSDLRSVTYMLVPTSSIDPSMMIGLPPISDENMSQSMSLVRTQISQSVARLAMQRGTDVSQLGQMTVLANEVQTLTFGYFDGAEGEWVSEWDSETNESLPTAVEIVMSVRLTSTNASGEDYPSDTYRMVVHLPLAEPPDESSSDSSSSSGDSSGDETGDWSPIPSLVETPRWTFALRSASVVAGGVS